MSGRTRAQFRRMSSPNADTELAVRSQQGDDQIMDHITCTEDYILDKKKAIKKKIKATEQQDFRLMATPGGLRVFLSAAAYELFKEAFMQYAATLKGKCVDRHDKQKLRITTTIKIPPIAKRAKSGYTINMYHTTCSLLVNGAGTRKFLEKDLPHIIKQTANSEEFNVSLGQANKNLKQLLEEAYAYLSKDKEQNEHCPICKEPCLENHEAAQCELQGHWVHYKCDKLSRKQITDMSDEKNMYICGECIPKNKDKLIATIEQTNTLMKKMQPSCKSVAHDEENLLITSTLLNTYLEKAWKETEKERYERNQPPNCQQILLDISENLPRHPARSILHEETSPTLIDEHDQVNIEAPHNGQHRDLTSTEAQATTSEQPICQICEIVCTGEIVQCMHCLAHEHLTCTTQKQNASSVNNEDYTCATRSMIRQETNDTIEEVPNNTNEAIIRSQDTERPIPAPRKKAPNINKAPSDEQPREQKVTNTKQAQAREQKCKKREEAIKQKEVELEEKLKSHTKLQETIYKMEARINELERSNRLLRLEKIEAHKNQDTCGSGQQSERNHERQTPVIEEKIQQLQLKVHMFENQMMIKDHNQNTSARLEKIENSIQKLVQQMEKQHHSYSCGQYPSPIDMEPNGPHLWTENTKSYMQQSGPMATEMTHEHQPWTTNLKPCKYQPWPQSAGPQGQQPYPQSTGPYGQKPYPPNTGPCGQQPYPPSTGPYGQQPYPPSTGPYGQQPYPPSTGPYGQQPYPPSTGPYGQQPYPPNTGSYGQPYPPGTGPYRQQPYPPSTGPYGQQLYPPSIGPYGQQPYPPSTGPYGQQPYPPSTGSYGQPYPPSTGPYGQQLYPPSIGPYGQQPYPPSTGPYGQQPYPPSTGPCGQQPYPPSTGPYRQQPWHLRPDEPLRMQYQTPHAINSSHSQTKKKIVTSEPLRKNKIKTKRDVATQNYGGARPKTTKKDQNTDQPTQKKSNKQNNGKPTKGSSLANDSQNQTLETAASNEIRQTKDDLHPRKRKITQDDKPDEMVEMIEVDPRRINMSNMNHSPPKKPRQETQSNKRHSPVQLNPVHHQGKPNHAVNSDKEIVSLGNQSNGKESEFLNHHFLDLAVRTLNPT
jgi:hypothetical protein